MPATPIEQHNVEIAENKERWNEKPLLRKIYGDFYQLIAAQLDRKIPGDIVEIGSGMGNIKQWIPNCITTDLFSNPWLDRVENIYALSFATGTLSAVILFDVWHHLQYPGAALVEMHRALARGGRVIIFEPDMSLLGKIVYGMFHHEPLRLREEMNWTPVLTNKEHPYYAAQGNCFRTFVKGEQQDRLRDWKVVEVRRLAELAYVASGGFRGPQLFPTALLPLVKSLEKLLGFFPSLFSTRLLVTLARI